jgi:hypothetical protein
LHASFGQNVMLSLVFTAISIAGSFVIRRLFEAMLG